MLEVLHQIDSAVAGTNDAQVQGDVPVFVADGSREVTCTPPGRTVSRSSMASVQEKAFRRRAG